MEVTVVEVSDENIWNGARVFDKNTKQVKRVFVIPSDKAISQCYAEGLCSNDSIDLQTLLLNKTRFNLIPDEKAEFALNAILPYVKDKTICGKSQIGGGCQYQTKEGRMCVFGKFMKPKIRELFKQGTELAQQGAHQILTTAESQSDVLIAEAVDILTSDEWQKLQYIHDAIAEDASIQKRVTELGLFSYTELEELANK